MVRKETDLCNEHTSIQTILEAYDEKKDNKILKNSMEYFVKEIQANGIYYLTKKMSFFQSLKKEGKITKNVAFNLLNNIFTNIRMKNKISDRTVKRANYFFKDVLLVYVAIKYPKELLNTGNIFFDTFPSQTKSDFSKKLNDIVNFIQDQINPEPYNDFGSFFDLFTDFEFNF